MHSTKFYFYGEIISHLLIPFFSHSSSLFAVSSTLLNYNQHKHPLRLQARAYSTDLTHVDEQGRAKMVNVIDKPHTKRKATAHGHVNVGAQITKLITNNLMKKGDVLSIAQLAGIMGAKQTSNLVPLTHPIPLSSIKVDVKLNEDEERVEISASIECFWNTGIEIEALTAVSIAALTIYDMCKAVSHDITITDIKLVEKSGGKNHFKRT
jgi:molybdenum cofactor biosynthesis protein MoaC